MKEILIDLSYIREGVYDGIAKYAYRLLEHIRNCNRQDDYVLLAHIRGVDFIRSQYPDFQIVVVGRPWMNYVKFVRALLYAIHFRLLVNRLSPPVVFCPYANENCCLSIKAKKIVVTHDMQLRIDLNKGLEWVLRKTTDDIYMRNSDAIVTISEFSRQQILSFYPQVEKKLFNLYNSVYLTETGGISPMDPGYKYLLYVGRLDVMKNVMTLVKAFDIIRGQISGFKLVLVSNKWDYWDRTIFPYIKEHGLEDKVVLIKSCSEADLTKWYLGASLFVFPSLREGYGSPPIEAGYMKIPVISTKCDSLEEVTLGLLNYYEPPTDERALARRILDVLSNPQTDNQLQEIKDRYRENYSIDVIGERICRFIDSYNS